MTVSKSKHEWDEESYLQRLTNQYYLETTGHWNISLAEMIS